jgi:hypothetical protein
MENVNATNNAGNTTSTTTAETTETTTFGPVSKFFKSKTTQAVLGGIAVVGAGAYGYMRFIATGDAIEAAEAAGEAVAAMHNFFAA